MALAAIYLATVHQVASMEAVKVGRKRRSRDSSEAHAEAPKPKKKKKASKPELSSPLESVTAPDLLPLDGANGSAADETTDNGTVNSSLSSSQTNATLGKTEPTKKAARVKNYFKPRNGSWMTHMASVVVHRCVTQALAQSIDPRPHLNEINWGLMSETLLRPEDVKMLWYYITKEYPDGTPLQEVAATLATYSKLSVDQFVQEDIKLKLKQLKPKAPTTAYHLFCKAKQGNLKKKHPELCPVEVTAKLGRKWKSMGEERKAKYKRVYKENVSVYHQQMEEFYTQHPYAKELLAKKKKASVPKNMTNTSTQTTNQVENMNSEHENEGEEEQKAGDSDRTISY